MRPTDPARLAHHRCGSGPPLVLVHGIGSRWQVWRPVLADLARHRDVIAVDLPGFGVSPPWPAPGPGWAPGSVPHLADRVAAFLDALGLDRVEVAGNSLGGGVALELGRRGRATRVTAFAPIGFWGPAGRRWCQAVVGAARFASVALRPALPRVLGTRAGRVLCCGAFHGRPGRLDPAECVASAAALAGATGLAAARTAFAGWRAPGPVGVPVTVVWGTRDLVLPYRTQARRARAALPAARHVALPGCGHLPFADAPEACARLMIESC
ncbi:alpha/beta fold hydrolase [Micromonospora fluostatini]|uniref:alpha/beta fold hydrolase n=1 Tax=Micromonospora sp. JCM 30529 TaxID=3421643 RepID=UPI003D167C48